MPKDNYSFTTMQLDEDLNGPSLSDPIRSRVEFCSNDMTMVMERMLREAFPDGSVPQDSDEYRELLEYLDETCQIIARRFADQFVPQLLRYNIPFTISIDAPNPARAYEMAREYRTGLIVKSQELPHANVDLGQQGVMDIKPVPQDFEVYDANGQLSQVTVRKGPNLEVSDN